MVVERGSGLAFDVYVRYGSYRYNPLEPASCDRVLQRELLRTNMLLYLCPVDHLVTYVILVT